MDSPSTQLHHETHAAVSRALATRRPILHHLNADTSWLLQIPRPANAVKHGSRIYYNVLIDPWFQGAQSDVARWFSQQWHAVPSMVKSVAEVEDLVRRVEGLAGKRKRKRGAGEGQDEGQDEGGEESLVDAVAVSHEFTDHCHRDTLLEVHPDVPVFATEQAAKLISSWHHFRSVTPTPTFTPHTDWRTHSLSPLPTWLSISRLTASNDTLNYHSALLLTFSTQPLPLPHPNNPDPAPDPPAETILYTPHGIPPPALHPLKTANPPLQTLAFLHGLHDIQISLSLSAAAAAKQQLNLGAKNGVAAQKVLGARYWVATHDEVKKGGGVVSWFLRRRVWRVGEVVRGELGGLGELGEGDGDGEGEGVFEDVRFRDLGNGEGLILE